MTKKLPQLWGGKQTSGVTPQQLEDYFAKSREYQSRLDSKNDSQTKSKWVGNRNGAAKSSKATSAVGNPGALRTEPPVQTKPSIPPADGAEASEPQSQKNPARRLSITSSFKAKKAPVLRPAVATLSKDAAIYPGAELVIFDFDTAAISPATKALQQIGFSVTIVPDYEKAVLHCKRESVEVLILALRAPSFHAIHILKSLQPLKSAVIITVDDAPNGLENEINQCFNLGASSCMRKPLNIQRLAHKVVALMELEKNADQVFWESAKYRDPDYAANKAKELIAAAGEFKSMNPEEKKMIRTLDEHGPVAATRKRDKNTFREFTRVQTNNGGARGRANIRNVLTAPSAPRKSTSSSGKKRRSSVRFEDSYPSGKETAFDPLRFAALPWELRDDAYVTKLGFNNNRDFQDSRDILQCELREVIPAESNTSSEHKFLLEGRKMRRSGNLQGAICMYNRAAYASRNCNFWPVFICRGVAFHLVGNDAQAMADFSRCLEIEPDNPDALFNRALLRYTLHDTNGAVADLNEALRLAPEDEEMVYCRGYIFRRLARFDEAKGDYQRHHTLLREREKEAKELRNNSSNKALARSRVDTGLHSKRTRHGHSAGNKQDEGVFGFNFDSDSEDEEKAKRRRDRRTRRRKRRAARIRRQNREQGEWAARGAGPARAAESESDSSSEGSSSSSGDDDDDGSRNGRRGVDDDDDDDLRSLGGSDSGSAVGANTKKEWDMNGDGRVDLEEFKTANNLGDNVFESMFNQKSPLERALQKKSKGK
jgi:tetratricopeptide (TPR) repeat protein/DNA-binding response OmpR family regulator